MKNQKITEEQHDMLLEELMRQEMLFSENGKFIPTDSYYRDVGLLSLLIRRINKRIDKDQEGSTDSGIQYRFIETPDYADDECKNDT